MAELSSTSAAQSQDWRQLVRPYTEANAAIAVFQLVSTLLLYAGALALMGWSLQFSYGYTLLLAVPAGGLAVRLFVLFHDCCHLSFFSSTRANEIVGSVLGPLVFTSYHHWRLEHNHHHATSGNLDKRGVGDVPTVTRSEFESWGKLKQIGYRGLRNPFILFTVGAVITFVVLQRFWGPCATKREKVATVLTDVAIFGVYGAACWLFGWQNVLMVIGPTISIAATAGIWLFYMQHQFPETYWAKSDTWSYKDAALKGSSFYDLPPLFRYFSGNIGFHHIHHLSPKVPNYRLVECHRGVPEFQVKGMGFVASLRCLFVNLIDDQTLRVISFGDLARAPAPAPTTAGFSAQLIVSPTEPAAVRAEPVRAAPAA